VHIEDLQEISYKYMVFPSFQCLYVSSGKFCFLSMSSFYMEASRMSSSGKLER